MKYLSGLRSLAGGASLAVLLFVVGSASAAMPTHQGQQTKPPTTSFVSGPQAEPPVQAGSRDAQSTEPLGSTNLVKTDSNGKSLESSKATSTQFGAVAGVDFQAPLNYCSKGLVYTPVKNTTSVAKSIQVRLYNQGGYRDVYTSVAAGATVYPAFYFTTNVYSAYLYVWNGTSYQYDEYKGGNNTCNVSVTRTSNAGGWVQLKIQNLGTAYASQKSTELAPYAGSGTYTGTHYDYPVAGGAAIYRWFSVGTSPYGIVSSTSGSFLTPYLFSGDL
jgi:hypothetical protein